MYLLIFFNLLKLYYSTRCRSFFIFSHSYVSLHVLHPTQMKASVSPYKKYWQKDKCHLKSTCVASGSTLRAELECGLELAPLRIDSASLCEMNSELDDPEF